MSTTEIETTFTPDLDLLAAVAMPTIRQHAWGFRQEAEPEDVFQQLAMLFTEKLGSKNWQFRDRRHFAAIMRRKAHQLCRDMAAKQQSRARWLPGSYGEGSPPEEDTREGSRKGLDWAVLARDAAKLDPDTPLVVRRLLAHVEDGGYLPSKINVRNHVRERWFKDGAGGIDDALRLARVYYTARPAF